MALTPRFEDALVLAARLHGGDVRKSTTIPYVSHVLGVASIALEHGASEDEAIAALLHDAIEDAEGDPAGVTEEIQRRYGTNVLDIVRGCTDTEERPEPPWRARKENYIAKLPSSSPSVRLVSVSDKLQNARAILSDYRAIGEAVWARSEPSRSSPATSPRRPGARPAGPSARKRVIVYLHDTERHARHGWTLDRLLVKLDHHRPVLDGDPDRTFIIGGTRNYLAISTAGAHHFTGLHPLWGEKGKIEGAMLFDNLLLEDVRQILEKFYAGRHAEGCFAPYYGRFEFYRPPNPGSG